MAILDEDFPVTVVQHTARRTERERPLMVVLGHLLELRVLDDLQQPEADAECSEHNDAPDLQRSEPHGNASTIFLNGHIATVSLASNTVAARRRREALR